MDTYGIDYEGKDRTDWIKSLIKAMGVQAVTEIEIKTTQQKKAVEKKADTRPTKEKMGDFFNEEESDPIEDEINDIK